MESYPDTQNNIVDMMSGYHDDAGVEGVYLKAIFLLQKDKGYTRSVDVANHVGRTKATVSYTMKQLKRKGYIQMSAYGEIYLTQAGLNRADEICETCSLIKQLLLKVGADEQVAEENSNSFERVIAHDAVGTIRNYLSTAWSGLHSIYD